MTYLDVHILFLLLPVVFLFRRVQELPPARRRAGWRAVASLVAIATVWTTPWDNQMVRFDVWTYPPDAVIGTILYVPIEEHLFFILQPIFTGCVTLLAMGARDRGPRVRRVALASGGVLLGLFAGAFALPDDPNFYYLWAIAIWFLPPLALQFFVGGDRLLRRWKRLGTAWLGTTGYLCLVDGLAMRRSVWTIEPETSLGWMVGNVPIEEIAFFAVTNALVIGGVALYVDLIGGGDAE